CYISFMFPRPPFSTLFPYTTLFRSFHRNRRLESFYQKLIGELRMGMVLVDRGHDDPGRLVPAHRRLYQLLSAGKLKQCAALLAQDRKSTRLNSSHVSISYAVFCLKK